MSDIEGLLKKATPPPWYTDGTTIYVDSADPAFTEEIAHAGASIRKRHNMPLIVAAVNALARGAAGGWQPIETAPKNSKSILLGCDYDRHGKQRVTLGWWDDQFEPSGVSGCWIEGWFYDPQEDQNEPMRVEFRPSHWMPLPEPPVKP